jgi:hypothetical protein
MVAITLEAAKNVAIVVAIALVAVMVLMAWLVKAVMAKLISVLILGGLALGVWTQRTSLEDCAKKVKERGVLADTGDTTCSFLGSDIRIPGTTPPP